MITSLPAEKNFLGITEPELCDYKSAKFVIQPVPYEHTSSYHSGSAKGPAAMIDASRFVEFYDEELDQETYKLGGIATISAIDFGGKVDADAVDLIQNNTYNLIKDNKFVISLGAEHTVTLGLVRAHAKKYPSLSVLQIDAHSDLRQSYNDNIYSHASVMARVHDLNIPLTQIGIRAQCREEAELIRSSKNIFTFYAHDIRNNKNWMEDALKSLGEHVYLTIDADGFDPSIMPAVGTAEPRGLLWDETLTFLKKVISARNIVGIDVVEIAPVEGNTLSEYTCAKLIYRLIGYLVKRENV